MTSESFELEVQRAVEAIPEELRSRIENLVFQVEDWASPEVLADMGFDSPLDLLGDYHGWPLSERDTSYGQCAPDVITIYQKAVEAYADDTGEPLGKVIFETLVHELAHYFGFSEEEMDEIETLWADSEKSG